MFSNLIENTYIGQSKKNSIMEGSVKNKVDKLILVIGFFGILPLFLHIMLRIKTDVCE